jgi:hypothetical protein
MEGIARQRRSRGSGLALKHSIYIAKTSVLIAWTLTNKRCLRPVDVKKPLGSFLHYHRNKQLSLWSWLRSSKETESHAYFSWDDSIPAIYRGLQLIGPVLR